MTRKARIAIVASGIALLAFATWRVRAAEAPPTHRIEVAGSVRAQSRTIAAPFVAYPTPDYAVGIPVAAGDARPSAGTSGGSALASNAAKAAARSLGIVAGRLATVTVSQGDHVVAGQVVARLDPRLLDLGVEQALTAAARSRADVALMDDRLDSIAAHRADLADATGQLAEGRATLLATRTRLRGTRADLVAARAQAAAGASALRAQIAQLESVPGTPTPQQAQLLKTLRGKFAQVEAGVAKIDAGLARVDAGLAKVGAGLAKLPSAQTQLATARTTLTDAERQVLNARDTLRLVAEGRDIGVRVAQSRRAAAAITAPEAGTVTYTRSAGTAVMTGAPVARLRPDATTLVDCYLTASQLTRVRTGTRARVRGDSLPGRSFSARIAIVDVRADFPPNTYPTDIVHMTRTVRVTLRVDDAGALPPGTPVDVTILPDLS